MSDIVAAIPSWLPLLVSKDRDCLSKVVEKFASDVNKLLPLKLRSYGIGDLLQNPIILLMLSKYMFATRGLLESCVTNIVGSFTEYCLSALFRPKIILTFTQFTNFASYLGKVVQISQKITADDTSFLWMRGMFYPPWMVRFCYSKSQVIISMMSNNCFEFFKTQYLAARQSGIYLDANANANALPWNIPDMIPWQVKTQTTRLVNRTSVGIFKYQKGWCEEKRIPLLPMSSVILPEDIVKNIRDDFEDMDRSNHIASLLNVRAPIAYIFYGLPGSGKTSLIHAIASAYGFDLYNVSIGASTDATAIVDAVENLIKSKQRDVRYAVARTMVIIEDFDRLFEVNETQMHNDMERMGYKRSSKDYDYKEEFQKMSQTKLDMAQRSFARLLNLLDGMDTPDGFCWIGTCNKTAFLNQTLMRDGRVTRRIHFTHPQDEAIERYVRHANNVCSLGVSDEILNELVGLIMKWREKQTEIHTLSVYTQIVFRWAKQLEKSADVRGAVQLMSDVLDKYHAEKETWNEYRNVSVD